MEDTELSRILGNRPFKEGLRVFLAGMVGEPEDIGDGLHKVRVSDEGGGSEIVVVGTRGVGYRYHCPCDGPHPCRHEAAAMIAVYGGDQEAEERAAPAGKDTNEGLYFVESQISNLRILVQRMSLKPSDPQAGDRTERAERMVGRICDDISETIRNPDNAVRLYLSLIIACRTDFRILASALSRKDSMTRFLASASPESVASCIEDEDLGQWAIETSLRMPFGRVEEICEELLDTGVPCHEFGDLLIRAGMYEEYIEGSDPDHHADAVVRVMEDLHASGEDGEASEFVSKLPSPDRMSPAARSRAMAVLDAMGDADSAASVAREEFLSNPSEDGLRRVLGMTDRFSEESLVADAMSRVRSGRSGGYGALAFLTEHGMGDGVGSLLESADYRYSFVRNPSVQSEPTGSPGMLVGSLVANGHASDAIMFARRSIEDTLSSRDAGKYGRAASLLVMLDGIPDDPGVRMPHAEWKALIRTRTKALHGFWGAYRDEGGDI